MPNNNSGDILKKASTQIKSTNAKKTTSLSAEEVQQNLDNISSDAKTIERVMVIDHKKSEAIKKRSKNIRANVAEKVRDNLTSTDSKNALDSTDMKSLMKALKNVNGLTEKGFTLEEFMLMESAERKNIVKALQSKDNKLLNISSDITDKLELAATEEIDAGNKQIAFIDNQRNIKRKANIISASLEEKAKEKQQLLLRLNDNKDKVSTNAKALYDANAEKNTNDLTKLEQQENILSENIKQNDDIIANSISSLIDNAENESEYYSNEYKNNQKLELSIDKLSTDIATIENMENISPMLQSQLTDMKDSKATKEKEQNELAKNGISKFDKDKFKSDLDFVEELRILANQQAESENLLELAETDADLTFLVKETENIKQKRDAILKKKEARDALITASKDNISNVKALESNTTKQTDLTKTISEQSGDKEYSSIRTAEYKANEEYNTKLEELNTKLEDIDTSQNNDSVEMIALRAETIAKRNNILEAQQQLVTDNDGNIQEFDTNKLGKLTDTKEDHSQIKLLEEEILSSANVLSGAVESTDEDKEVATQLMAKTQEKIDSIKALIQQKDELKRSSVNNKKLSTDIDKNDIDTAKLVNDQNNLSNELTKNSNMAEESGFSYTDLSAFSAKVENDIGNLNDLDNQREDVIDEINDSDTADNISELDLSTQEGLSKVEESIKKQTDILSEGNNLSSDQFNQMNNANKLARDASKISNIHQQGLAKSQEASVNNSSRLFGWFRKKELNNKYADNAGGIDRTSGVGKLFKKTKGMFGILKFFSGMSKWVSLLTIGVIGGLMTQYTRIVKFFKDAWRAIEIKWLKTKSFFGQATEAEKKEIAEYDKKQAVELAEEQKVELAESVEEGKEDAVALTEGLDTADKKDAIRARIAELNDDETNPALGGWLPWSGTNDAEKAEKLALTKELANMNKGATLERVTPDNKQEGSQSTNNVISSDNSDNKQINTTVVTVVNPEAKFASLSGEQ